MQEIAAEGPLSSAEQCTLLVSCPWGRSISLKSSPSPWAISRPFGSPPNAPGSTAGASQPAKQDIKKPPLRVVGNCLSRLLSGNSSQQGGATERQVLNSQVEIGNVLPGIALFSQGAAPQLSLPLLRLTPEFEMDRGGSTAPWTPG